MILPRFRSGLLWTALLALVLVAGGDVLFFQQNRGSGAIGFYFLALLAATLLRRHEVRRSRLALIAASSAAIYALAMVYDASLLAFALFWVAAAMTALLPAVARFDDGWRWVQRLFLHGARAIVAPALDLLRVRRVRRYLGRKGHRVLAVMAAVALPVAGSAVILALFAAANPVLERALNGLLLTPDVAPGRFILWGLLLAGTWSLLHPRPRQMFLPALTGRGDIDLPGVSAMSVTLSLIAFNLLLAMQNVMDIAFLGGVLPMPAGMTLADYAHRGAYPLIVTALLSALFVLVTLRPGSRTATMPAIRIMVVLWIAQNVLLVGSSILRTMDYVDAYSLTVLRIAALAWMVLVAIGLMLICWRMLRGRSAGWLINANMLAAAFVLTGCCFVDLGSVAAWWNVRHAREAGGRSAALDLCYMAGLGPSALLPLIDLESRPGLAPEFRERVRVVRGKLFSQLDHLQRDGDWTWLGDRRMTLARRALAQMPETPMPDGLRDCDGSRFAGVATAPEGPPPSESGTSEPAPLPANPVAPPPPALTAETRP